MVIFLDVTSFVHRTCGPNSKCEELQASMTTLEYCGTCDTALCNSAPSPHNPVSFWLFAVASTLAYVGLRQHQNECNFFLNAFWKGFNKFLYFWYGTKEFYFSVALKKFTSKFKRPKITFGFETNKTPYTIFVAYATWWHKMFV